MRVLILLIPFILCSYIPVLTPNNLTLPFEIENGVKVFRLNAAPIQQEFASGFKINCWGYNGHTPGPTIEAVEGDHVRIYVTNNLPEPTTVHWHGIILPNDMDGVAGITQKPIMPNETFCYEFTLQQSGTCMYHSHYNEMVQIGMGLVGMFVIHPKNEAEEHIDHDFVLMLQEWAIAPGAYTPDPQVMNDFNTFTINGHVFPATDVLKAMEGGRVKIRLGNLSMDDHPMHLHGYAFKITGTGAGPIPKSAQIEDVTVSVPVGSTRDIQFLANNPGNWLFHCHKTHHMMNGMVHGLPNLIGVSQTHSTELIKKVIPEYMAMEYMGMATHMQHMKRPPNTIAHAVKTPYGAVFLGGMVTILEVDKHDK